MRLFQSRPGRLMLPEVSFFVLFLLACADVVSLPIAGGNFRLFYIVGLGAFFVLMNKVRLRGAFILKTVLLFALLLPGYLLSIDRTRSALYLVWIALTLVCTFGVFPQMLRFDPVKGPLVGKVHLYTVLLQAFRFQIIAGVLFWLLGIHERTRFLYYEPSYFSIALSVYVAIVAFNIRAKRRYGFDLVLMAVYMLSSASGAFALVLLISLLLNLPKLRLKYLLLAAVGVVMVGALYVALVDDANTQLVRALLDLDADDLDLAQVLLRGGNRMSRLTAAWDVFVDHPVFGVGLGGFEQVSRLIDVDEPGIEDYLSSYGLPAIDIYLEILATAGVVGLIGFAVLLAPIFRWIFGRGFYSPLSRGAICMLLILTWESNYLRPYLWVLLALCGAEMRHAPRVVKRAKVRRAPLSSAPVGLYR